MTDAAQITDDHTASRYALYITDAELIRRMGVPEKIARAAIRMLDSDRRSGFPPKSKLWGGRRYWPAVRAYLDRTHGLMIQGDSRSKVHDTP